jgi:endonuclease YncB( thermonuclease family)
MIPSLRRSARPRCQRLLLSAFVLVACSAHAETLEGKVVGIADGDSLTILLQRQQIKVRLIEIDAPEIKQAFGKKSRESLAQLCAEKIARVVWAQKDRHGRRLGRVWCAGIDANAEQVRRGMAWVFDRYVTDRTLYATQDYARTLRVGIWADASPVPPWEWRRLNNRNEFTSRK